MKQSQDNVVGVNLNLKLGHQQFVLKSTVNNPVVSCLRQSRVEKSRRRR